MAYSKQNFVSGQFLTAQNLELMEDGILERATIDSPVLTGEPKAPTFSTSWRDDKIATTKFVHDVMDEIALKTKNAAQVIFTVAPAPSSPLLIKLTNQQTGTIYDCYTNDLGIAYINVTDYGTFNIS